MEKRILITGGAGYIGSFMARCLKNEGFDVVILDNLSNGHIEAVKDFRLEKIDLVTEAEKLDSLFANEKFDAVVHMASFIQMGESFVNPSKYYRNNVVGVLNLLDTMVKYDCKSIIFSSSAGVYGNPTELPITEDSPKNPLNPYGETKYMIERILDDYDLAHGIKYMSFRYFNAAGASLDGLVGEAHIEESHLIPNVILKALKGEEFEMFGNDYETPDGTTIRDYIHVLDLVHSHALGLKALFEGKLSNIFNIGIGKGYSNMEVVKMIEKIGNLKVNIKFGPRRKGDANALYASNDKIKNELGWVPKYDLDKIVETAFIWHKSNPDGYQK